jgi:hypothetical protein
MEVRMPHMIVKQEGKPKTRLVHRGLPTLAAWGLLLQSRIGITSFTVNTEELAQDARSVKEMRRAFRLLDVVL